MSEIPTTCNVEPFRYQATPQPIGDQGASSNQINEQAIEDYLNRLREAICADLTELFEGGDVLLAFTQLTDTPDTYAGSGGLAVAVNAGATGLEFVQFPTIPPAPTYFLTPRLIGMWGPNLAPNFGVAMTAAGAGQLQIALNPTNTLTANYRQGYTSGTGANAVAGIHVAVFQCVRGSAAPMGGFRLRWRFGIELYTAGARCWIGLFNTAGSQPSGATDPSANTNVIFLGFDDTDTTWQVMHNDAAGTCTKIDLLSDFTINTTSLMELTFEVEPSGDLTYTVRDLSLGFTASGTVNSDLPAGGQPLKPCMQIGSAATGASNRISHIFASLEVGPGE